MDTERDTESLGNGKMFFFKSPQSVQSVTCQAPMLAADSENGR